MPGRKARRPKQTIRLASPLAYADVPPTGVIGRMNNFGEYLDAITIPVVFGAVSVIADALANLPLQCLDDGGNEVDIREAAPDLADLLEQPNPTSDGFHFRELQAMDLLLTGNNVVAMEEVDLYGRPHELYRLRPDRVRIMVGDDAALRYGYQTAATARPAVFPADQIVHWKRANPRDPLWGMGEVEAGEVALSADRLLAELIRAYFERGAILDGVIMLPQEDLTDEEYDRLLSRWRGQRQKGRASIKTGVLTGGADYKNIQEPLGNIPIVQLKRMSRNDVLELFGVPPAKLGDFIGSNYRNSQEADAYFYAETVAPLARRIQPGWTSVFKLWNPRWRAHYLIPSLAADFEARAKAALALSQTNSYRRDEIRAGTGHPAFPDHDPRGDEIVNTSKSAVPAEGEVAPDQAPGDEPGQPPSSSEQGRNAASDAA